MIEEFARAKVNLALHVLGRRADGYHELDSIVAFADIGDRLTFTPAREFSLSVHGPFAGELSAGEDNLALRAARVLDRAFPGKIAPARIALKKCLPIASGLGGGSADAAAALRGLLRHSSLELPREVIHRVALELGADVPVCVAQATTRLRGIGERLEPVTDVGPLHAVLANPGVASRTPEVFRVLGLPEDRRGFAGIVDPRDLASCRNDLETPAINLVPVIANVLQELRRHPGLAFARMTGSGASCFGVFQSGAHATEAARRVQASRPDWWCVPIVLG